jgi:hypothetical protein
MVTWWRQSGKATEMAGWRQRRSSSWWRRPGPISAPAPSASGHKGLGRHMQARRPTARWWYVCGARATAGGGVTRPALLQPRTVTFLRRKSLRREETRRAVLHFVLRPGLLHLCISFCSRNGAPSELRSCSPSYSCPRAVFTCPNRRAPNHGWTL